MTAERRRRYNVRVEPKKNIIDEIMDAEGAPLAGTLLFILVVIVFFVLSN